MRRVFVVFAVVVLLCGFFGGLVAQPCLAEVGDSGVFGSTTSGTSSYAWGDSFVCSAFALPVDANVTEIHAYVNTYGYAIKFFIYSLDGVDCEYYSDTLVVASGAVWANKTGVNTLLSAGTYLLGYRVEHSGTLAYKGAGNGMNGTVSYNGAWGSLSYVYLSTVFSVYANYTEAVVTEDVVTSSIATANWGGFVFFLAYTIVEFFFLFTKRGWIYLLFVGLFGMGISAFLANAGGLPASPYSFVFLVYMHPLYADFGLMDSSWFMKTAGGGRRYISRIFVYNNNKVNKMVEREHAEAYFTIKGYSVRVTPVHWDADAKKLVFENDNELYSPKRNYDAFIAGRVKSIPLYLSKPLDRAKVKAK